jgi:hypothetical protein
MANQTTFTEKDRSEFNKLIAAKGKSIISENKKLNSSKDKIEALHNTIKNNYESLRWKKKLEHRVEVLFNLAVIFSPAIVATFVFPAAIPLALVASATVLIFITVGNKLFGKKITRPNTEQINCYKDKQIKNALRHELVAQICLTKENIANKEKFLAYIGKELAAAENAMAPNDEKRSSSKIETLKSLAECTEKNIRLNNDLLATCQGKLLTTHNDFEKHEAQLKVEPAHTRWLDLFEINSAGLSKKEITPNVMQREIKEAARMNKEKIASGSENSLEQFEKSTLERINKRVAALKKSTKPTTNRPPKRTVQL